MKRELTVEEKKQRRQARNRESARGCRLRKKEFLESLRDKCEELSRENLQLRLKLRVGQESIRKEAEESTLITSKLDSMIKEVGNDIEIQKAIEQLQEKYSDYGKDRRSAITFHLNELRHCLKPTQTTRSIVWLISCAPYFYFENGEPKLSPSVSPVVREIWKSLIQALQPTDYQIMKLVELSGDLYGPFPLLQKTTEECDNMLDRLQSLISNKNASLDSEMSQIQSILSARQIAKFIIWIDRNPACMQMLEALWPHLRVDTNNCNTQKENP